MFTNPKGEKLGRYSLQVSQFPVTCTFQTSSEETSENGDVDKNRISRGYSLQFFTQFKCRTVFRKNDLFGGNIVLP